MVVVLYCIFFIGRRTGLENDVGGLWLKKGGGPAGSLSLKGEDCFEYGASFLWFI